MFSEQFPNVIGHLVALKMFDEKLLRSARKVGGPRDFNPILVVKALLAGLLSDPIRIVSPLVEPLMVSSHFSFQTLDVKADERVDVPQTHALV